MSVRRAVRASILGLAPLTLVAGVITVASPASADAAAVHYVYATGGEGLWLHPDSPTLHSTLSDLMGDGTEFDIDCWSYGDDVNGDAVWLHGIDTATGNSGYAADYYVDTDVTQGNEGEQLTSQGVPQCGTAPSSSSVGSSDQAASQFYDREAAKDWAIQNVGHAPLIQNEGDCTWFVSQALWAGGLPESDSWARWSPNGILGNDYEATVKALVHGGYNPTDPINPTLTATNANDFVNYLVNNGLATKTPIDWSDNTASGAQLGDIIAYDWDHGSDGTIDHVTVVTGTADGTAYPTVTQHSPAQQDRYWSWSERDQSWIEFGSDYQPLTGSMNGPPTAYLIHIVY